MCKWKNAKKSILQKTEGKICIYLCNIYGFSIYKYEPLAHLIPFILANSPRILAKSLEQRQPPLFTASTAFFTVCISSHKQILTLSSSENSTGFDFIILSSTLHSFNGHSDIVFLFQRNLEILSEAVFIRDGPGYPANCG